jgi:hypothetical protein
MASDKPAKKLPEKEAPPSVPARKEREGTRGGHQPPKNSGTPKPRPKD